MKDAGSFHDWRWLDISDGMAVQWWRRLSNIAHDQLGRGVRSAWVRKRDADWFEFHLRSDTDPAQPGTNSHFTNMIWREAGRRLDF